MFWSPKTLKCQIYDNNVLVDLNSCSDDVLEDLSDAVMVHWKTPDKSAVWFDAEIYEKHHFFKHPTISIDIACYKIDAQTIIKRRQIDISRLYIDKMLGKKFKINPISTLIRKWSDNVEVAFVI